MGGFIKFVVGGCIAMIVIMLALAVFQPISLVPTSNRGETTVQQ